MSTNPGPDELRVRQLLVKNGVGPHGDTQPAAPPPPRRPPVPSMPRVPPVLPQPPAAPAPAQPTPTAPTAPPKPPVQKKPKATPPKLPKPAKSPKAKKPKARKPTAPATAPTWTSTATVKKRRKPHDPNTPRSAFDTRPPAPRQSLVEAWDRVPYRLKWLAYHASAAYLGWSVGLADGATYVTAWIFRTGIFGPQAIFWCCVGAGTFLIHHLTRHRWLPVAWLGAVPASSVVAGVLLYGTGYHQ